jgi:hypothetical protein
LWLGTLKDNAVDMVNKGRANKVCGEDHPWHKHTKKDIIEIRRLVSIGISQREVGRRFSTDHSSVAKIASGISWKHIPL